MYSKLLLVLIWIFMGPNSYEYKALKEEIEEKIQYDQQPDAILYFLDLDIFKKVWLLTFDFFTIWDVIFFFPKLVGCFIYTALYLIVWIIVIVAALLLSVRLLNGINDIIWGKRK